MSIPRPSVFGYPIIRWIPLKAFLDMPARYSDEGELETIVQGLPLSQALELCAILNLLVANPQDLFFERGDAEVLSRLALYDRSKRRILRYLSRHAGCRVLTRVNLIALMNWVAWLSQESSAHMAAQKDGFLIAAIVAGDRFIASHGDLWNMSPGPDHYNPARIQLAYQVSFWGSGRGDPVRALGLAVSRHTLLRLRRRLPIPRVAIPQVFGIDAWAFRNGQTSGTVLIDLERHQALARLPDREAKTVTL